jgi:hypothetical protein
MKRIGLRLLLTTHLVSATGCVGWRRQDVPPAQLLSDPDVRVVRVTRSDSSRVVLYQPRIVNDTLHGLPTELAIQRINIPMADITEVATRYRHLGKSLLAGIAIIGGVAIYGLLQELNQP